MEFFLPILAIRTLPERLGLIKGGPRTLSWPWIVSSQGFWSLGFRSNLCFSMAADAESQDDVASLLAKLGIMEEELEDVVFEEAEQQPEEATRWLAVAKVHTENEFSHFWFFKNMRSAWDLAKEVKIRVIDDNLFVLRFECLGDWEKVMEGCPWVFRGKSVLIAPYDGFMKRRRSS